MGESRNGYQEGMFDNLPEDSDGYVFGRKVAITIQTVGDGPHSMWFSEELVAPALRQLADAIENRRLGVAEYEESIMFIDVGHDGERDVGRDQMILVRMQAMDGLQWEDTNEPISVDPGVDAAVLATLTDEERAAINS